MKIQSLLLRLQIIGILRNDSESKRKTEEAICILLEKLELENPH